MRGVFGSCYWKYTKSAEEKHGAHGSPADFTLLPKRDRAHLDSAAPRTKAACSFSTASVLFSPSITSWRPPMERKSLALSTWERAAPRQYNPPSQVPHNSWSTPGFRKHSSSSPPCNTPGLEKQLTIRRE